MNGKAAKLIEKFSAAAGLSVKETKEQKIKYKTTPGPYRKFLKKEMLKTVPPKKPRSTKKVVVA